MSCGLENITLLASFSIIPHSAWGAWMPNPRNEKPDICRIIEHMALLEITAISDSAAGIRCR
ncbi:hypothetical protein D3C71_2156200 [compost metagenome]